MRRLKVYVTGLAVAAALGQFSVPAQAAQSGLMEESSVQSAVQSAASSNPHLRSFYEDRGYEPLWFNGSSLSRSGEELIEWLTTARVDGLDPEDYRIDRLIDEIVDAREGSSRDIARADVLLSRALVSYVRDLNRRPAEGGMTFVDEALVPKPPAPQTILAAAEGGSSIAEISNKHPLYDQLRRGYAAWLSRWGRLPQVPIPEGPALSPRATGERVRLLRQRLGLPDGSNYDAETAEAVRAFQQAHGIQTTGIAGPLTIAQLNRSIEDQDARIRLNIERARLLPGPQVGRHIVVDAAAQRLWLYEGAHPVDSMKVVVGKPSEPTPMMAALIRYAAVNPYWNVPPDLVAKRIAPNVLTEGMRYLTDKGYEVLSDWSDNPKPVDPTTVDWKGVAEGRIELPVRQLPGEANMMGAMKFMFPNQFGVYLHDTPEKNLFGEADRRRSSGCVRLEDASRVARWLFGTVPTAPSAEREHHVPLEQPVPVFITYLTATPEGQGIAFREDFYDRDGDPTTRLASAQ